MSMNTDEKERVQEELYDETLLDQYLENDDIDQFRDEFLALHTHMNKVSILKILPMKIDKRFFNIYHLKRLQISLIN